MARVLVTSKSRVTIPKQARQAPSRSADAPGILNYKGPRIPIAQMRGGVAMKKAGKRARR